MWNRQSGESFHVDVNDTTLAAGVSARWSDAGQDAYFGTGLRRTNLGAHKRGGIRDVIAIPGLWLDVDVRGPAHVDTNVPPSDEVAVRILSEVPFSPTLLVSSGHGLHAWWLFRDGSGAPAPWFFPQDPKAGERAERLSESFQRRILEIFARATRAPGDTPSTKPSVPGYTIDKTADLARVLRLPGTTNRKIANDHRFVELLLDDGPRFTVEELEAWAIRPRGRPRKAARPADGASPTPPSAPSAGGPPGSDTEPAATTIEPDLSKALPVDELLRRLTALKDEESRELLRVVLAGEPWATEGGRDTTLQRLASIIAFVDPWQDPEVLAEVLRESWEAVVALGSTPDNPAPTWDEKGGVIEKIARAQVDARTSHEERLAAEERIKATLRRNAAASRRPGAPPAPPAEPAPSTPVPSSSGGDGAEDPPTGGPPPAGEGEGTDGPGDEPAPDDIDPDLLHQYTMAEIERWSAEQGTTPEAFRQRWIIQRGTSYYVFVDGAYRAPITREELAVSLRRDLARAPIEWTTPKVDGGWKRKTVTDLLDDYATVARHVTADLSLQKSWYDAATETFYEAVCPLRDLEPTFNEAVDKWLRLLGSADIEKFLDWIATITVLDRATCALYLSGPPSTGKTMLASGLARLWTDEQQPTELMRVLDSFNGDLASCPLVVADEHIPQTWKGQRTSAELRLLVGATSHTLARKYLPNARMRGAIRLMLLANNDRLLQLGDEDLGSQDLAAVAGRFLHLETPNEAGVYLESLGGRAATEDWVAGDIIARHALWLRGARTVIPGKRFLVEGHATRMHKKLATQGTVPSLVTEWLARYLDQPHANIDQTNLVICGNGRLLVNTTALTKFWDTYFAKSITVPTTTRIGRALTSLAARPARVGSLRYHQIDTSLVFSWAEANQVGDLGAMQERLDHPNARLDREPGTDDEDEANGAVA